MKYFAGKAYPEDRLDLIEDGVLNAIRQGRRTAVRLHPALWDVVVGDRPKPWPMLFGVPVVVDSQCPGMIVD